MTDKNYSIEIKIISSILASNGRRCSGYELNSCDVCPAKKLWYESHNIRFSSARICRALGEADTLALTRQYLSTMPESDQALVFELLL